MDKQLLQTLLDKSDAKKSSSMREALAKRKAAGEPIGRQREITKEKSQEILALRSHGLSYRQIAMQLKVSGSAVQRAIKRGIDG